MLSIVITIELLKNSIMGINKITSIAHFNATETDGEFIFQQLYCTLVTRTISQLKIKFKYIKNLHISLRFTSMLTVFGGILVQIQCWPATVMFEFFKSY